MTKALITRETIFKTAKTLTEQGVFPTQGRVREYLGHGSMRDIGFYLREWKQQCFVANKAAPLLQEQLSNTVVEANNLEVENKKLGQQNQELQQQIKDLTNTLAACEKRANKWQLETEKIQAELVIQKKLNQQLTEKYNLAESLLQEKTKTIDIILADKNELIASLRQELKDTIHRAIVDAREDNHRQNDKLMEIKIENLNLQEEIKLLNKKIKEPSSK